MTNPYLDSLSLEIEEGARNVIYWRITRYGSTIVAQGEAFTWHAATAAATEALIGIAKRWDDARKSGNAEEWAREKYA